MLPSAYVQSPVLKNRKILAIDDDPNVLHTISLMMRSAGIQTELLDSGEEALRRLNQIRPDLILLDYMMPGLNGAEFYRRIQSDPYFKDFRQIPVIMLTAKTDNYEEQEQLLREGMSAYLLKPFGFGELINVIANTLTLQEIRNENLLLTEELRHTRNYLQTLFNSIQDCISVQNTDYTIQSYNQATADLLQNHNAELSPEGDDILASIKCHQLYFGLLQPCPFCLVREVLQSGEARFLDTIHPVTRRDLQISIFPIQQPDGAILAFIEIIRDITEKKKMEKQMIESSRMASLGALAMGVAHEINNPLCIILGFAQSLRQSFPLDHPAQDDLAIIEEESERCAKIVQDLLNYARPAPSDKKPTDIRETMQNAVALLQHSIRKKNIHVTESYPETCPLISVDPQKIRQVFINILMNAIDAIDKPTGMIHIGIQCQNDLMNICIEDNGQGIDAKILPTVFEPFVTTKTGHGSGLGLAVCRSIIQEHQGDIHIESKPQIGTRVLISLPNGEVSLG